MDKLAANSRYAQFDESSSAEGAVGYDVGPSSENIYETICNDPAPPRTANVENIYETIEDIRQSQQQQQLNSQLRLDVVEEPIYDIDQPSCSNAYGRIGNAYGRIDIIGHGIGRIERHLSSSCGSINSNHHASIENTLYYGGCRTLRDSTGRISKVSVQWLLANKWLPLWIANTENGRDYKIIDFLIAQGLEQEDNSENSDNEQSEQKPTSG